MKNFSTRKLMVTRDNFIFYKRMMDRWEVGSDPHRMYEVQVNNNLAEYHCQLRELNERISSVQGGAKVRTIDAVMVLNALLEVNNRLYMVNKKHLEGCIVTVDCNAQDFAKSYKGVPQSTVFTAIYKRGAWVITTILRSETRRSNERHVVSLTNSAAEDILDTFRYF